MKAFCASSRIFFVAAAALAASGLSGCYVSRLAWEQGKLLGSREDISEVLAKPETPPSVRERLTDLAGILEFARECGLTPGSSYRRYIDNGDRPLSWLVYAAKPDRLESITWWFPLVGRVPYLGFFDKKARDEEEAALKKKGYDTARGTATGYSLLGFLPDPVYRSMTRRSRDDFAHLIFHELVHRTVWIEGGTTFNERLAEVLARRMTVAWLARIKDDAAIEAYKVDLADTRTFGVWLHALRRELEKLYVSTLPPNDLVLRKAEVFAAFTGTGKPTFKGQDRVGGRTWNNAEVLAATLYDSTDFDCPLIPAEPAKLKAFMAWLGENKQRHAATSETLEKACR
ncbi:MAG: hypothetical protein RIQ81_2353 [Pseudomonadota bacterium]